MLEVTSDDAPGDGRDDGRSVLLARRLTWPSPSPWTAMPAPAWRSGLLT
jgi:hypothetical protein